MSIEQTLIRAGGHVGVVAVGKRNSMLRIAMAGVLGNLLEWFDFAVYGYFSGIIGQEFFFSPIEPGSPGAPRICSVRGRLLRPPDRQPGTRRSW